MKKIACLGPEGTYSDVVSKMYNDGSYEIEYYPSIIKAIDKVSASTIAIVPFENTLDGFVMESLDKISCIIVSVLHFILHNSLELSWITGSMMTISSTHI